MSQTAIRPDSRPHPDRHSNVSRATRWQRAVGLVRLAALAMILLAANRGAAQETDRRGENRPKAQDGRKNPNGRRGPMKTKLTVQPSKGFQAARDQTLFSGPQPGEPLPGFEALQVTKAGQGESFDPVARAKGRPMLVILQDETPAGIRGMMAFSRVLSGINRQSEQPIDAYSILLGDDTTALTTFARRFVHLLPDDVTLGISPDGRDGPGKLGINRNIPVTLLIAKDGTVTHNFAFPGPMTYPDPHVLGAIAEVLETDYDTVRQWLDGFNVRGMAMRGRKPKGNRAEGNRAERQRKPSAQ